MSPKKRRGVRKSITKSSTPKVEPKCVNNDKKIPEAFATPTAFSQMSKSMPASQRSSRRLSGRSSHNTTHSPGSPTLVTNPGKKRGRKTSKRLVDIPKPSSNIEDWSDVAYVSNNQASEPKDNENDVQQSSCEIKSAEDTVHADKSSHNEEKYTSPSYLLLLNEDISNELIVNNINNDDNKDKEGNKVHEKTLNVEVHREEIVKGKAIMDIITSNNDSTCMEDQLNSDDMKLPENIESLTHVETSVETYIETNTECSNQTDEDCTAFCEKTAIDVSTEVISKGDDKFNKVFDEAFEEQQAEGETDEHINLEINDKSVNEAAGEDREGNDKEALCDFDDATVDEAAGEIELKADDEDASDIVNKFAEEIDNGTSEVNNKTVRILDDELTSDVANDSDEISIIKINDDDVNKFDNDMGNKIDKGVEPDPDFVGFEMYINIAEGKGRKHENKIIEESENILMQCTFENSNENIPEIIHSDSEKEEIKENQEHSHEIQHFNERKSCDSKEISNKSEKKDISNVKISEDEYSRRISACEDIQASSMEDPLIYDDEDSENETEPIQEDVTGEILKHKPKNISENFEKAVLPISDIISEKETLVPGKKATTLNTSSSDDDDVIILENEKDNSFKVLKENLESTKKAIPDSNLSINVMSSVDKNIDEFPVASKARSLTAVNSSDENKLLKDIAKIDETLNIIKKEIAESSEINASNKSSPSGVAARQSKIPGRSFIIAIRNTESKDKKTLFDCVLCFDEKENCVPGSVLNKHIKSREHSLKVMEICNRDLYNQYKDDDKAKAEDVINAILKFELTQKLQVLVLATRDTYRERREMLISKIASLKRCTAADEGNSSLFRSNTGTSSNVTPLIKKPSPAVSDSNSAPPIPAAMSTLTFLDSLKRKTSADENIPTKEKKNMTSQDSLTKEKKTRKYAALEAFSLRLAKKQKNRKTDKIVLVMDGRDPDVDVDKLGSNVRVLRVLEATFNNMFSFIKSDEWYGKGTMFVFLNAEYTKKYSTNSQNKCNPVNVFEFSSTNSCILIEWCLKLHKEILDNTSNDQAMFCEVIPINIQVTNADPGDIYIILSTHVMTQYLTCIKEFNEFAKKYVVALGLPFWDMVKCSFVSKINDIEKTLDFLKNDGISFQNEDCAKREKAVIMKTKLLLKCLHQSYKSKTGPEILQLEHELASDSKSDSAHAYEQSELLFQKICFITDRFYQRALMNFSSPYVEIFITEDLETDSIKNCILKKLQEMPENTLWVALGNFCIAESNELNSCSMKVIPCSEPLTTLIPNLDIQTSNLLSETINKIRRSSMVLLTTIRKIIPTQSEFFILPAYPPTIISEIKFSHSILHLWMPKDECIYVASETVISQLNDAFTELNKEIISLSTMELKKRNCPHAFLSNYLISLPESHIQVVRKKSDPTTDLFCKWKTCISELISQVLVAAPKKGTKFDTRMIESPSEDLFDHFVLIGRQEQLSQISYSESVSLSLWDIKFPLVMKNLQDRIKSLLPLISKRILFVIFGDFSMISTEIIDYQTCKALKCTKALSYMIIKSEEVQALFAEKFGIIYELIKYLEGVFRTSTIVLAPLFPRHCIERIPEASEVVHGAFHFILENSSEPCILEGERGVWEKIVREFQDSWNFEVLRVNACDVIKNLIKNYLPMDISLIHWIKPNFIFCNEICSKYSIQVFFDKLVKTVYTKCSEYGKKRSISSDLRKKINQRQYKRIKTTPFAKPSATDIVELENISAPGNSTMWEQSEAASLSTIASNLSSESSLVTNFGTKYNEDLAQTNSQVPSIFKRMPLYQQQGNAFPLLNNPPPPLIRQQQSPLVLNQPLPLIDQQQLPMFVNQLPLSVSQPLIDLPFNPSKNKVNKQGNDSFEIKSTVQLRCTSDSFKKIWVKRDQALIDFLREFDSLPKNECTFDHAYIVGKKEMIQPLAELNLKSITTITEDLSNANEGQALYILNRMNLIRPGRSVCFLAFGLSVITNTIFSTPGCLKFKCVQPIHGSYLKFQEQDSSNTSLAIITRIKQIVSLGSKLSNFLSVVILPIYPARVFCDNASVVTRHRISHLIAEKAENESYILVGNQKDWEEYVGIFIQTWNNFMKTFHDRYSYPNIIPKYPYLKECTITFKQYFDDFLDDNYTDPSMWVDTVHNMLKFTMICAENVPKSSEEPVTVIQSDIISQKDFTSSIDEQEAETFEDEEPLYLSENVINVPVKISNVSEAIPEEFFTKLFTSIYAGAVIEKHNDYFIVHLTRVSAFITVNKLNNLVIGDSAVKAEFVEPQDDVPALTTAQNDCFISIYVGTYQHYRLQVLHNIKEKLSKVVDSNNFKTEPCTGNCNRHASFCKFYHSLDDRRRNPLLHKYSQTLCSHPNSKNFTCPSGEDCNNAHNIYEQMFHPTNFQTTLCPMHNKKISKDEICKYAHAETPEVLFTSSWKNLVVFGTQNSFQFVVGAIRALQKLESRKDVKICLISQNAEMLDTVELVLNEMLNLPKFRCANLLKHIIHVDTIDDYDVFLGTPFAVATFQISLSHPLLSTVQVGALIVDNIGKILNTFEDGGHLFNICKVLNFGAGENSLINKVFVANSYDPAITGLISSFFGISLKEVNEKVIARSSLRPLSPPLETKSSHSRRKTASSRSRRSRSSSRPRNYRSRSRSERSRSTSRSRIYGSSRLRSDRSSSRSRRYKLKSRFNSKSHRNSSRLKSNSKSSHGKRVRSPSSDVEIIKVKSADEQFPYEGVNTPNIGNTNRSERISSLQDKLGNDLFSKYLEQEKTMQNAHEKEFRAFKAFPELHPCYKMFYEEFLREYNQEYGRNKDEDHKDRYWKRFWDTRIEMLKNLEWKKQHDKLENEYIEKSKIYSPFQTESYHSYQMPSTSKSFNSQVIKSDSFSVENTLNLLEQLSINMGMLGPALTAIISSARKEGINDKGLAVFADKDSLVIFDMIREKMKSLQTKSSPTLVLDVTRALEWTDKLLEYAKAKEQQKKTVHGLDLYSIAKSSVGKGSEFTLNLIKTAFAYEGIVPSNNEEINELFISVCKIHFEMTMNS